MLSLKMPDDGVAAMSHSTFIAISFHFHYSGLTFGRRVRERTLCRARPLKIMPAAAIADAYESRVRHIRRCAAYHSTPSQYFIEDVVDYACRKFHFAGRGETFRRRRGPSARKAGGGGRSSRFSIAVIAVRRAAGGERGEFYERPLGI